MGNKLEIIKNYSDFYKNYSNKCIVNWLREDRIYGELNDNILIIGAGILCKVYMYKNLYNNYHPDLDVSKVEFYTKA
jgi:hypothetical protein